MSDHFTYEDPDEELFLRGLLKYLQVQGDSELYNLLKKSKCQISTSGSYSGKRWDAAYTIVYFRLPIDDYEKIDEEIKERLVSSCDLIMPKELGLDVMEVEFSPLIETRSSSKTMEDDLTEIITLLGDALTDITLPEDVLTKGQDMAEAYLFLYTVENFLRIFIENIATEYFGDRYFDELSVPKSIQSKIEARRNHDAKNQWMSIRGDSELFYIDFKDLGSIITHNWNLFKAYFPEQSWITSKLDELYKCRNLVAHNSYLGEHERDIIRINFRSIVRQLNTSRDDFSTL